MKEKTKKAAPAARSNRTAPALPRARGPKPKARPGSTKRLAAVFKIFSPKELAGIAGVTRQAVEKWQDIPAEHARAIEKASGGKLSKEFLAPNFYPRSVA